MENLFIPLPVKVSMPSQFLLIITGVIAVLVLVYIAMNVVAMAHFVTTRKQKRSVRLIVVGFVATGLLAVGKLLELLPPMPVFSWEDISLLLQSVALLIFLAAYYLRLKHAKEACDRQIKWYKKTGTDARRFFYGLQVCVIILTAATPVLILAKWPEPIQGVAPAIASIAAGLAALFQFRPQWRRRVRARHALENERLQFETRTGPYKGKADDEAIDSYVQNIIRISDDEFSGWEELVHKEQPKETEQK